MADHIEREAAIAAMDSLLHQNFLCVPDSVAQAAATAGYMDGVKDADIRLRSIPAADVRPVVRGKWRKVLQNNDGTSDHECSACKGLIIDVPDDDEHPLCGFCPNCGADMRPQPPKEET